MKVKKIYGVTDQNTILKAELEKFQRSVLGLIEQFKKDMLAKLDAKRES
ncbi:hypothetical protein [Sporomusa aerivorans]